MSDRASAELEPDRCRHGGASRIGATLLIALVLASNSAHAGSSKTGAPAFPFAFEQQLDGDGQPDLVALDPLKGRNFKLTISPTAFAEQTIRISIGGTLAQIQAGTLGNFTGKGMTLALVMGGAIRTVSLNREPRPLISGASSNYVMISTADLNGDVVDDLVAQHEDGKIDVFIGSPTGLRLEPNIKLEPLDLGGDALADFVWTSCARIFTWNSLHGLHSAPLSSQDSVVSGLGPGRFRVAASNPIWAEDTLILSKDAAGGGVVSWYESRDDGLVCRGAIEARSITGNDPIDIEVNDWDGNGLDDVAVSYANGWPKRRIFLAYPEGFRPLDAARSTIAKSTRSVTRLWEGGKLVTISLNDGGANNTIHASMIDDDGNEGPVLDTGIPFVEPLALASANFNGDTAPMKDAAGRLSPSPLEDVAILSGQRLIALLGHANLTFTMIALNAPPDIRAISAQDVPGNTANDLWALRADGTKLVFPGIAGAKGGLTTTPRAAR